MQSTTTTKSIETIRAQFPILRRQVYEKKLVYLDNAATAQKPQHVIDTISRFYSNQNANVHRGLHTLSEQATVAYEKAHSIVAKFINAKENEIVFTSGTTQSLNLLAYSLGSTLQAGDEIVLSQMEHHANIVPWQQVAKRTGAVIKYIPITKDYTLDMSAANTIIGSKTKIVSIVHMSNVLGTINPVADIAKLAHTNGAVCIVDAAQSVPHMKIDVQELDCDYVVFSGHKMCGPTGIGVLYGKEELLEKLEPAFFGGDMIKEVTFEKSTWNTSPAKFEAGTPPIAQAIGLASAVEYLQGIGMDSIESDIKEISRYALPKLLLVPGLTLIGPVDNHTGIFSFTIEGLHPHDISDYLNSQGIAVRAGHHCAQPLMKLLGIEGTTRASFYFYNTKQEVDKLVGSLTEFVSQFVQAIDRNEISSGELSEEQEIFKENILDHYRNPRNKQELEGATHTARDLNPYCGDELTIQCTIDEGIVTKIAFTGHGCAISQAAASILVEYVEGKNVSELIAIDQEKMYALLGIPITHTRRKCAMLAINTSKKCVEQEVLIQ